MSREKIKSFFCYSFAVFIIFNLFFVVVPAEAIGSCVWKYPESGTETCNDMLDQQNCDDVNGAFDPEQNCAGYYAKSSGQSNNGQPQLKPVKGLKGASGRLENIGGKIEGLKESMPLEEVIGNYIKTALTLLGVIFLVLMVYGGFVWMRAQGDEQEVEKAKNIITAAIIGLAVVLAAYAITYFVVYRLTVASGVQV